MCACIYVFKYVCLSVCLFYIYLCVCISQSVSETANLKASKKLVLSSFQGLNFKACQKRDRCHKNHCLRTEVKKIAFYSSHFDCFSDDNIVQTFRNKTKTASWVVSNCNYAPSRRNDLVKALQQYIDVDVYGHCGPLKCPKDRCEAFLDENYKFYFAFENALCDDYLSEKVYKILETNMIPVIYSGADLPRFLPDKSYIDANSFATVDELGKYLKFLSENPKEFVKYFWWRDLYKTLSYFYHVTFHQMCNICVKLNDPNFKTKRQSYTDIRKWYTENACYDPHIQF